MEEKRKISQPKKNVKSNLFVLLIGFFLIIRGGMRIAEEELTFMGILMLVVGIVGVVYYFLKR